MVLLEFECHLAKRSRKTSKFYVGSANLFTADLMNHTQVQFGFGGLEKNQQMVLLEY